MSWDRETFVEFHQVSSKLRWIYVGNNAKLKVNEIDTCKVDLCDGRSFMLQEVLYAQEILWNIVFVSILVDVGFDLFLCRNSVRITFNNDLYGPMVSQPLCGPTHTSTIKPSLNIYVVNQLNYYDCSGYHMSIITFNNLFIVNLPVNHISSITS